MIYGSGCAPATPISVAKPLMLSSIPAFRTNSRKPDNKPVTVRFDVVNLFDTIYQIRSGTGIGVFAPQYGPRRGYYLGISKKL